MRTVVVGVLGILVGLGLGFALAGRDPASMSDAPDPVVRARGSDVFGTGAASGDTSDPEGRPTLGTGAGIETSSTPEADRRAWVLRLIEAELVERKSPSAAVPPELRADVIDGALRYLERDGRNYGAWLDGYLRARAQLGVLSDPPRIHVQARGAGTVAARGNSRSRPDLAAPIDTTATYVKGESFQGHVASGVIPFDKVLVIERVDLRFHLGLAPGQGDSTWTERGRLRVRVGGRQAFERDGAGVFDVRGSLRGRAIFRPPFDSPGLSLEVAAAVCDAVAHGRFVPIEEARNMRGRRFHFAPEGDDGLLGDEPVLLQVLADHGGGNPHTLYLDGTTNAYLDGVAESNLWDASKDLSSVSGSSSWSEDAGVVPEGRVFRITRIDWRARLSPKKGSHSGFRLRGGGRTLVEKNAKEHGADLSGTWTGELDIAPGEERGVSLTCSYFGMGEAVIHGQIVDPDGK